MTTDTGTSSETQLGSDSGAGSPDDAGAKERAQQAASTATDEGKRVAGVAAGEAKSVAAEAAGHARNLVGEAQGHVRTQVDQQGRAAKDQLAGTLGGLSDDLGSMAESSSGLAADLAHEVAGRAGSLSRHLDAREPSELLDDVRRFARQRPGTFLLGALAAGIVVGRLARGTKDAIEAAEAETGSDVDDQRRVTSGAPDTTSVHASHGQPTQPSLEGDLPTTTGYSSPPAGTGLGTFETDTPAAPGGSGGSAS